MTLPGHTLAPQTGAELPRAVLPAGLTRRLLVVEVVLVLSVSLGRSAVYAVVDLAATATAPGPLSSHQAVLNASLAPGRVWLDLVLQLLAIGFGVAPAFLAGYLLVRSGSRLRQIWFPGATWGIDVARGLLIAAVIGGSGIAFYLITYALGVDLTVVAEDLPSVWWRIPVLALSAVENAVLEEVVMLGYVLVRLEQIGLSRRASLGVSALIRGSYHLYQGVGGFLGNLAMGLVFGWLYHRWGRLTSLVVAHTVLDLGAFIGYALLLHHVGWLPS